MRVCRPSAAADHTARIAFLNDAWGGSDATDRNLYVDEVSFNGDALRITPNHGALFTNDTLAFIRPATGTENAPTYIVSLLEDAYQGDARALITLDGKSFGTYAITNPHGGGPQTFEMTGAGPGSHVVGVTFLNDAWGGSANTDRNLYVAGVSRNGIDHPEATASLFNNGTVTFTI